MAPDLLILSLMFLVGGLATLLVGRRAALLGIPGWLGRAILITGALVTIAGLLGVTMSFFGPS